MTQQTARGDSAHRCYSRPVLFVSDLTRALDCYVDPLGFTEDWHEGDGKGTVCQVSRSDCEINPLSDRRDRPDKARLFIELTADGLRASRRELADRSVQQTATWWGYDTAQVNDPDGYEFFFPVPK